MAEIINGELIRNETNQNSMGGTELLAIGLTKHIDKELLKDFQIVSSRVRDLDPSKIRIFWAHDLAEDPESHFLKDKNNQEKFHKFVFVSNWQMQNYIKLYDLPWSKCIVIRNAITPIEKHDKPDPKEKINLIYTSTPHRGLNILVPVFEKLTQEFPGRVHLDVYSSFNLYGWGQRDEQFKPIFEKIDAHPDMTNHGSVSNDEIREALKKAHILAYPSTWQETSCLVLIEAMSARLIPIHSNLAALYETAANWTYMYQYNEDPNAHAGTFYNMLRQAVGAYEQAQGRLDPAKNYIDIFHSWANVTHEWNGLLTFLKDNVKDRSIASEAFIYKTTA